MNCLTSRFALEVDQGFVNYVCECWWSFGTINLDSGLMNCTYLAILSVFSCSLFDLSFRHRKVSVRAPSLGQMLRLEGINTIFDYKETDQIIPLSTCVLSMPPTCVLQRNHCRHIQTKHAVVIPTWGC